MKTKRSIFRPLWCVVLTLLLAACQQPPPTETWAGVSEVEGVSSSATLVVERRDELLIGSYTVDAVRGSFTGALSGTALEAELAPSADCSFTLSGTITDVTLTAEFQPLSCPGGKSGTWSLERQ